MALTEQTRDYEILVRFNPDGKIGAHRQTITEVLRDGEPINVGTSLNEPTPLDLAGLQAFVAALTEDDWYVPPAPVLDELAAEQPQEAS